MLRTVAEPHRGRIKNARLFTGTPRDFRAADRVAVQRQMRTVLFEARLRNHDRVGMLEVFLHVRGTQIAEAVRRELELRERSALRSVGLILKRRLDVRL